MDVTTTIVRLGEGFAAIPWGLLLTISIPLSLAVFMGYWIFGYIDCEDIRTRTFESMGLATGVFALSMLLGSIVTFLATLGEDTGTAAMYVGGTRYAVNKETGEFEHTPDPAEVFQQPLTVDEKLRAHAYLRDHGVNPDAMCATYVDSMVCGGTSLDSVVSSGKAVYFDLHAAGNEDKTSATLTLRLHVKDGEQH